MGLLELGYRGSISASEFVEALTALLEVGNSTDKDSVKINNDNNDDTDGEEEEDNSAQKLTNLRKDGFRIFGSVGML